MCVYMYYVGISLSQVDWPTGWTKPDRTIFQAEFFSMVQTAKHWFYGLRLKTNHSLWFGLRLNIFNVVL
jgi:hypothetical protein